MFWANRGSKVSGPGASAHWKQERCMVGFSVKLLTLAMFSAAILAAPISVRTSAAAGDPPASSSSPPATDSKSAPKAKKKKTSEIRPGTEDTAFANGYRTAYATIYDRNDYTAAIAQLKALGRDDNAAVANLIGYSYRKLGDYKVSQDLVRACAEDRSRSCQDLAILRAVAARTGQPRSGAISPEPDRSPGRHQQRGISLTGRSAGKAARHRPRLLRSAATIQPAQSPGWSCAGFVLSGGGDFRRNFRHAEAQRRMAETEGFEPSIGLYNPITV